MDQVKGSMPDVQVLLTRVFAIIALVTVTEIFFWFSSDPVIYSSTWNSDVPDIIEIRPAKTGAPVNISIESDHSFSVNFSTNPTGGNDLGSGRVENRSTALGTSKVSRFTLVPQPGSAAFYIHCREGSSPWSVSYLSITATQAGSQANTQQSPLKKSNIPNSIASSTDLSNVQIAELTRLRDMLAVKITNLQSDIAIINNQISQDPNDVHSPLVRLTNEIALNDLRTLYERVKIEIAQRALISR
ncbi:hypothetical protein [Gimesia fumaroli]|nr:hypothetical protein [Gimesia fumaroli]